MDPSFKGNHHRPRILVVDDEQLIADTFALVLQKSGYHAVAAHSAEQAIGMAEMVRPQILISDVMMQGMNGVDLAVHITRRWPECSVLLCTGHPGLASDLVDRAAALGHRFTLLPKPTNLIELLGLVPAAPMADGSS
jgi:DNA-binding NtrC family response regulator